MTDARKDIIFHDESYKEKFRIKDGDSIKITIAFDGEEIVRKCRFLDPTHLDVGSSCYHCSEFMEKMTRNGNQYEPAPNQKPKFDILIAELGKPPRDIEIPISETAIRKLLGGEPEIVNKDKFSVTLTGKDGNGTIAVFGNNDGNISSLHPYDAQKYKRDFAASVSETEEKPKKTLAEQLEAGKTKAAAHNASRKTPDAPSKTKKAAEH